MASMDGMDQGGMPMGGSGEQGMMDGQPQDQGGNPDGGAGAGKLLAQVVFRFYEGGFVTASGTGEDEEQIESLDDAVGILGAVANQALPGGQGGMGGAPGGDPAAGAASGGMPAAPAGGQTPSDEPAADDEAAKKSGFAKGFNKARGGK